MFRLSAARFVFLSACLVSSSPTQAAHVPGRLLVTFQKGVSKSQANEILKRFQATSKRFVPGARFHVVELPIGANEEVIKAAISRRPEVEFAELDLIVSPSGVTPNDTYYGSQYAWALPDISLPEAWVRTTGSTRVVIAVIDTGIEPVPDLPASKLLTGYNAEDGSTVTSDPTGHGTMTAGTIAAVGNNGIGVASPCWDCTLLPVRVGGIFAATSAVAQGLVWAADKLSTLDAQAKFAYVGYALRGSPSFMNAAQYFYEKGGAVVMPVGNGGAPTNQAATPYAIVVAGVGPSHTFDGASMYGEEIVVTAPYSVITTLRTGSYGIGDGSSYAAALVAGTVGLMLSEKPCLSPAQVTTLLRQTATPLGYYLYYGSGLVNASAAVSMAANTSCPAPNPILCDLNGDSLTNVIDVQQSVNQALGVSACIADLNKDGACNVIDVQRVTNAALGGQCVSS